MRSTDIPGIESTDKVRKLPTGKDTIAHNRKAQNTTGLLNVLTPPLERGAGKKTHGNFVFLM